MFQSQLLKVLFRVSVCYCVLVAAVTLYLFFLPTGAEVGPLSAFDGCYHTDALLLVVRCTGISNESIVEAVLNFPLQLMQAPFIALMSPIVGLFWALLVWSPIIFALFYWLTRRDAS